MPLRLWRNPVFALSNVANTFASMALFGAIYFVPFYAQGVVGASATDSGAVLVPLTASMVLVSVVVGRLITLTGRYKGFVLGAPSSWERATTCSPGWVRIRPKPTWRSPRSP